MPKVPPPTEMPPPCQMEPTGAASHRLVSAFYLLMRDHVPAGTLEKLVAQLRPYPDAGVFTNGHLADYAATLADQLQEEGPRGK